MPISSRDDSQYYKGEPFLSHALLVPLALLTAEKRQLKLPWRVFRGGDSRLENTHICRDLRDSERLVTTTESSLVMKGSGVRVSPSALL